MSDNYTIHPEYHQLPESIKTVYSPKEYSWLDDESRRTLQQDMTLPEAEED